ncbi:hypothetical protein KIN20_023043 [Parelaphostrongylus tenuis]|uniref:Uncharacterized protein n=1 Tax=Parelaphostrongylus tenuis TaxID=148309 RepID=A0AAD5QSP5_PARTN|nr:hypothetical protein KIN20_023043 [Parelaphostrongylus tenuis]
MAELLVRTSLNEWAAQQEMAEQEKEVMARIRDASNARKMLRDVLIESKKKAEDAMNDRKNRYEIEDSADPLPATQPAALALALVTACDGVYSEDGQEMIQKTELPTTKTSQSSNEERVVPFNIMTTIQKALHDSLGLDVEFD